ncbi:hypothetical protein WN943_011765 [Citrus x changshan-huyou]
MERNDSVAGEVEEGKRRVSLLGFWGIYFDKTSHDEQTSGSRIPRIRIFYRSLVAGKHEHECSARSRMHPPRGQSGSQPPTNSIRPFLLEVEEGSDSREAYKKVTNEGKRVSGRISQEDETYISGLSVGGFTLGKHPACYDMFLCTQESARGRRNSNMNATCSSKSYFPSWVKPADRSSMTKVLEMLEGSIDDLQMPPKYFFSFS